MSYFSIASRMKRRGATFTYTPYARNQWTARLDGLTGYGSTPNRAARNLSDSIIDRRTLDRQRRRYEGKVQS